MSSNKQPYQVDQDPPSVSEQYDVITSMGIHIHIPEQRSSHDYHADQQVIYSANSRKQS